LPVRCIILTLSTVEEGKKRKYLVPPSQAPQRGFSMGSMVRTRTRFADNALPGADRAFIVESQEFTFYDYFADVAGAERARVEFEDGEPTKISDNVDCSDSSIECWIVAGSNSIDPVNVVVDQIPPEESNWGNQDPSDVKYELENIASNTNNPGYDQIFSNFPKGSENGGNVGSGEDEQLRNPLSVCKINLEKC